MSKRGDTLYLEDIRDAIGKIESYVEGMDIDSFSDDWKTIDAVVRNLSVIGEAVNNLSDETKSKNPEVSWHEIIGMRNKIVHEYFGVDQDVLWKTVQDDLPNLKETLSKIKGTD